MDRDVYTRLPIYASYTRGGGVIDDNDFRQESEARLREYAWLRETKLDKTTLNSFLLKMYIGRAYHAFLSDLLNAPPMDVQAGMAAWKARARPFGAFAEREVDLRIANRLARHTTNLISSTVGEDTVSYLVMKANELSNVCVQPTPLEVPQFGEIHHNKDLIPCKDVQYVLFVVNATYAGKNPVASGHAQVLIIDQKNATYELFDPADANVMKILNESRIGKWLAEESEGTTWTLVASPMECPYLGGGGEEVVSGVFEGFCGPWSALYCIYRFTATPRPRLSVYDSFLTIQNIKKDMYEVAVQQGEDAFSPNAWLFIQMQHAECQLLSV